MSPLVKPSRYFHDACAYWLMSSAGSSAKAHEHTRRRAPSTLPLTAMSHLKLLSDVFVLSCFGLCPLRGLLADSVVFRGRLLLVEFGPTLFRGSDDRSPARLARPQLVAVYEEFG